MRTFLAIVIISAGWSLASAQISSPAAPPPIAPDVDPQRNSSPADASPEAYGFERWLDMKTATFSLRYRNVADTDGLHEYEQGSQRTIADGKFKFDAEGKYSLAFHLSSALF